MNALRTKIGLVSPDGIGLMLSLLITSGLAIEAHRFKKAEKTMWMKTDHHVEEGTEFFDITYVHTNSCSTLSSLHSTTLGTYQFADTTVTRTEEMCMQDLETKINPAFQSLVTCSRNPDEGWYIRGNRRLKRWIAWFILAAVSIILVVSTMSIKTTFIDQRVTNVNSTTTETAETVNESQTGGPTTFEQQNQRPAAI